MRTMYKPKPLVKSVGSLKISNVLRTVVLIGVLALILNVPFVKGITTERQLPINTIFADDFEGSNLSGWFNLDNCSPTGYGALNQTHAFQGIQSFGVQCGTANTARDLRRTIEYVGDYVGVSVWRSYSDTCRTTGGSGGPFLSLEFDDPKDASNSNHWEAHLAYYCNAKVWQILDSTGSAKTISADITCSYNCALNTRGQEDWMYSKVIARRSTHQYVGIITPLGTYDCNTIKLITTNGDCTLNSFSNSGKLDATNWEVELGWQTFALGASCTCNGFFDNLLMTDETPNNPSPIVQLTVLNGLTLFLGFLIVVDIVTSLKMIGVFNKSSRGFLKPPQDFKHGFVIMVSLLILTVIVAIFARVYNG